MYLLVPCSAPGLGTPQIKNEQNLNEKPAFQADSAHFPGQRKFTQNLKWVPTLSAESIPTSIWNLFQNHCHFTGPHFHMVFSYSVVCLNDLVSDFSSPSDLIWSLQSSLKIFSRHIFRMNFCLFAHFRLRRFLLLPSSDLKPHVCWLFIAFLLRRFLISTVQSASFWTPSAFAAPDFSENAVGSELLKICCLKLLLLCQLRVFFVRSLILPDWKKCFPDILPIAVSALNFWSAVIFRNWLFGSDRFPAWFSVLFQDLASPDTESGKIRNPYVYFGLYPLCLDSACLAVGVSVFPLLYSLYMANRILSTILLLFSLLRQFNAISSFFVRLFV